MLRKIIGGIAAALCGALFLCAGSQVSAAMRKDIVSGTTELPDQAKFNVIAEPFEWGMDVTRLLVNAGGSVSAGDVKAEDFTVTARHYSEQAYKNDSQGARKVLDAYPVDENGNKVENGNYIVVELEYGKNVQAAHMGSYSYANYYTPLTPYYELKWNKSSDAYTQNQVTKLVVDEFKLERHTDESIENKQYNFVDYALYSPKADGTKKPLIIFFHGMGEGGTRDLKNQGVQLYAYQEEAFAEKEIQDIMGGSAYVLCPQSPDRWPTDGFESESKYLQVVKSLVDKVIADNTDIDTNRIYIGGLSMGGYMASRMMINYPEMFAAAFPCSQAYRFTEEDAKKMKNLPVWVNCSEVDGTCNMTYTYDSYLKLVEAGSTVARCAVLESNRQDPTCRMRFYTPESEEPTHIEIPTDIPNVNKGDLTWNNDTYGGHEAGWILAFANKEFYYDEAGNKVTIMEWVANQSLVNNLVLDTSKVKLNYAVGEAFQSAGLVVSAAMRDGSTKAVTDYTVSAVDTSKAGTYNVEVSYSGKKASFAITVANSSVQSTAIPAPQAQNNAVVKLSSKAVTLFKKGLNKEKIKATVSGTYKAVVWTSSNEKVVVVKDGVITAKKAGNAVITATVDGVSAACKVTVKNATFKVNKNLSVKKGKKAKIKVTISPKKSVKFKASNKNIKVNNKGVVTGVKAGKAAVTVTYMGVKFVVNVKVK